MTERARRLGFAASAIAALGLLAAVGWLRSERPPDRGVRPAEPPVAIRPRSPGPVGWTLAPGATTAIARSEVPAAGVLPVDLELREPASGPEPLEGRILAFDVERENRVRALQAQLVGEQRDRTRVELPADLLEPGLYLIEIRTGERSHLPLLRYRLEVR